MIEASSGLRPIPEGDERGARSTVGASGALVPRSFSDPDPDGRVSVAGVGPGRLNDSLGNSNRLNTMHNVNSDDENRNKSGTSVDDADSHRALKSSGAKQKTARETQRQAAESEQRRSPPRRRLSGSAPESTTTGTLSRGDFAAAHAKESSSLRRELRDESSATSPHRLAGSVGTVPGSMLFAQRNRNRAGNSQIPRRSSGALTGARGPRGAVDLDDVGSVSEQESASDNRTVLLGPSPGDLLAQAPAAGAEPL